MENKKNIFETISLVMGEIEPVAKNKQNEQQHFKYRGIDDVMNALSPALTKHKLFIVPEILEQMREERTTKQGGTLIYSICKIKYRFCAEDGSNVEAIVIGEGMDSGDKASNKAMAAAFKYACFQVFCIPTEEMKDPDSETHQVASDIITKKQFECICAELLRTGIGKKSICSNYKVDDLSKLTEKQAKSAIATLSKKPDKPINPATIPPDTDTAGLPFN